MKPTLLNGDIVFYKKYHITRSLLNIGDIVIFKEPIGNLISIKRIKKISNYCIKVSGDNSEYSKDSNNYGSVPKMNILGIVTSVISDRDF